MNAQRLAAREARSRYVLVSRVIEGRVVAALTDEQRNVAMARQRAVMALCDRGPTSDEKQQAIEILAVPPTALQGALKLG